jgi:hypothetical protein
MDDEKPEEERARVWREREALRKELNQGLPDTINGYLRTQEILDGLRHLKARYKELGGILYEDDDEGDA